MSVNLSRDVSVLLTIHLIISHKRLTQQKKLKERERKELDTLGRRHLANMRVVQRNVVYVVGIGQKFAKEEVRNTTVRHPRVFTAYTAHSDAANERVLWTIRQDF